MHAGEGRRVDEPRTMGKRRQPRAQRCSVPRGAVQPLHALSPWRGEVPSRCIERREEKVIGTSRLHHRESSAQGGTERWGAREGALAHVQHPTLRERAKHFVRALDRHVRTLAQRTARPGSPFTWYMYVLATCAMAWCPWFSW
jgi:hypothetical protein